VGAIGSAGGDALISALNPRIKYDRRYGTSKMQLHHPFGLMNAHMH
jgi:hypothetical protein